ncbi:hypothetical protein [Alkalicoccus luteus]|nr:hypothetical protein [Alkalicoccus luteus]
MSENTLYVRLISIEYFIVETCSRVRRNSRRNEEAGGVVSLTAV